MMWWLPATRSTLNPALLTHGPLVRRAPRERAALGNVERQGQLVGSAELSDEPDEGLTQILDRSLGSIAFAVGSNPRAKLSVSAPHAVFVLLNGVGDVHRPGHRADLREGDLCHRTSGVAFLPCAPAPPPAARPPRPGRSGRRRTPIVRGRPPRPRWPRGAPPTCGAGGSGSGST